MLYDELGHVTAAGDFSLPVGDAAGGFVLVGKSIDLSTVRGLFDGRPLAWHIRCTQAPVVGNNAPSFVFANVLGGDDALAQVATRVVTGMSCLFSHLAVLHTVPLPKVGDRFEVPISQAYLGGHGPGQGVGSGTGVNTAVPGTLNLVFGRRYFGLMYLNISKVFAQLGTADHTYTAGKFTARLGLAGQDGGAKAYPIGYNIR